MGSLALPSSGVLHFQALLSFTHHSALFSPILVLCFPMGLCPPKLVSSPPHSCPCLRITLSAPQRGSGHLPEPGGGKTRRQRRKRVSHPLMLAQHPKRCTKAAEMQAEQCQPCPSHGEHPHPRQSTHTHCCTPIPTIPSVPIHPSPLPHIPSRSAQPAPLQAELTTPKHRTRGTPCCPSYAI